MLRIDAIKKVLSLSSSELTDLYTPEMEVQVNVAQLEGRRIPGTQSIKYINENTGEQWAPFRIPWGDKEYTDIPIHFDLIERFQAIGISGWNFVEKQSHWVAYDFDSVVNHAQGISEETLGQLVEHCSKLPYLDIVRSTSGLGYHIYVHFSKPVPTENRTEHAALAKSLLSILTIESGFDWQANIDCVGNMFWIASTKQDGTNGLSYIKERDTPFPVEKIPAHWKDMAKKNKKYCKGKNVDSKEVEKAIGSVNKKELDEDHRALLNWFLEKARKVYWFETDSNMLVCHTQDLEKAFTDLGIKGVFKTNSNSHDPEQNCFAFPLENGAWIVRRFSKGCQENGVWFQDVNGWTSAYLGKTPTFEQACHAHEGVLDDKGVYHFDSISEANRVLELIDSLERIPTELSGKKCTLAYNKNRIVISMSKGNEKAPKGYLVKGKQNPEIQRVFKFTEDKQEDPTSNQADSVIRHTVSQGAEAGWYIHINNMWMAHSLASVNNLMAHEYPQHKSKEISTFIGEQVKNPWELICEPFQPEYVGNRQWNKDSPQFSVEAISGSHPTWDLLLKHLGSGITKDVLTDDWCVGQGMSTGYDYLLLWCASMFQRPTQGLPYLFFWSEEQNTGKSSFHESLKFAFKGLKGYIRADQALKNETGFNRELLGAVLCVVEEINLGKDKNAQNRMKDWVTSETLNIRAMRSDAYLAPNTTHWCQFANDASNCLVTEGDTRITSIEVSTLSNPIPQQVFLQRIREELPMFLFTCLNIELGLPHSRLGLPALMTETKKRQIDAAKTHHQLYFEKLYYFPGRYEKYDDIFQDYLMWAQSKEIPGNKILNSKEFKLKKPHLKGSLKGYFGKDLCLGNVSLMKPSEEELEEKPLRINEGALE